jgi:tetratricopeptide (TPR) repeat protein
MTNLDLERLKARAIDEAVCGNYEEAIKLNQEILAENAEDVDSLMQLAHAYWQIGSLAEARKHYRHTLQIDPNNALAKKRLALLNSFGNKNDLKPISQRPKTKVVAISDLIEEPGKTKIVRLSNIGKPEHLGLLKIGEQVFLRFRKRRLELRDIENNFIGCLPDDISKRLINFTNEKGVYECYIFSIDKNEVKAFIKEITKPKKFRHVSSFITEDSQLQIDDDEWPKPKLEDEGIDLDDEKVIISPEETFQENKEDEDEEDEDDDDDKETYQEYEE